METIKEMRDRHRKEIIELQDKCTEHKWSDWLPYEWAPGHIYGKARVCELCGLIEKASSD